MAQLAFEPGTQIPDSNGDPVASAKLYFYDAETTDDRTVYSDDELASAHAQPVVCDANGIVPAIYVPTGEYRVIIKTSADVTLYDRDNIDGPIDTASLTTTEAEPKTPITSKTATETLAASLLGEMINANPTSATFTLTLPAATTANGKRITIKHVGTANAVIIDGGASTIDGLNTVIIPNPQESLTFVSDGADWHIADRLLPPMLPQGYLTLLTGTPMPTSDQSAKGTVYYTFDRGPYVPVRYDGRWYNVLMASERSLILDATGHVASGIYDVFAFLNNGALTIGTGPVWTTVTAGSGARGTGAGTTELTRSQGIRVNANSITLRNNSTNYSVAANEATYLGSIEIDGTAAQVTCHVSTGTARKWGVWNNYNRKTIVLRMVLGTASWTYAVATYRRLNANANAFIRGFVGIADEPIRVDFRMNVSAGTGRARIGIGHNSTTAASGVDADVHMPGGATDQDSLAAQFNAMGILGTTVLNAIEQAPNANTTTFQGTSPNQLMTCVYRG